MVKITTIVLFVSGKPHVLLLVIKLAFTSDGVINSMKSESEVLIRMTLVKSETAFWKSCKQNSLH